MREEILETLKDRHIDSIRYEQGVHVIDGQVVACRGKEVLDASPSDEDLETLMSELLYQEFGVHNVGTLLEDEFGEQGEL